VEKIYGLTEEWLTAMKPYLVYPNVKKINSDVIAELITEPFDPNVADSITLFNAGYKPWQIVNINRFRNRGGIFHVKEDLLKLYNVDSAHFFRIQDFVVIQKATQIPKAKIEINSADSLALIKVKGIGPATASRLLKLRNECGGIAIPEQLFDIYGMDTSRYEQIIVQIDIDVSLIKKININQATVAELAAHPYISPAYAKEIVNFRKKFQFYQKVDDINKLSLARLDLFTKLAPYLTTGN
jgi:DNA uptake protein ComE-like DNA-binding protein